MSPMLSLLNEIRKRPVAIYVGSVSLLKLVDFLHGYEYAVERLGHGRDMLLPEFRDWVHTKFKTTSKSWQSIIVEQSVDEMDAMRRFWELLDQFLKERASEQDQDGSPGVAEASRRVPA